MSILDELDRLHREGTLRAYISDSRGPTPPGVNWTEHVFMGNASAEPAPADVEPYDALSHAMDVLHGTNYTGEQASKVAKVLRQWSNKWAAAVDLIAARTQQPAQPTDAEREREDAIPMLDELLALRAEHEKLAAAARRLFACKETTEVRKDYERSFADTDALVALRAALPEELKP